MSRCYDAPVHPADHVKIATAPELTGPNRVLHQGAQKRLDSRSQNFDDTPVGDGPFLHRAMHRRPTEPLGGNSERMHAIDMTFPHSQNSPGWFHMLHQGR